MTHQQIEIKHLNRSPLNVRKTDSHTAMEELKASIVAHGLMQNLVVIPAKKKGKYEVIAGGRRLEALSQLRDEGKLPDDYTAPCRIADPTEAAEMSLAENVVRQAMHPADEHAAFAALVDAGATIEAIALRFGKTSRQVEQRLKLGRAAPELIQAYREGEITLEVLEAFTVTDDRERQLAVYEAAKDGWQIERPREIRDLLTEWMVAGKDKRVKFVGLDIYEKAGGKKRQDLFEEAVYLENPELLNALVSEKLKLLKAELEAEGWLWVVADAEYEYSVTAGCRRLQPQPVEAPQELLDQKAAVEAEQKAIEQEWQEAHEDDDELLEAIREKNADAEKRLEAIEQQLETFLRFDSEEMKGAGCYAYIDRNGGLSIERGLVKREESKTSTKAGSSDSDALPADKPKGIPESLTRDLEAYRLGVAQAEIAKHPAIAFDLLVFKAAKGVFGNVRFCDGAQINFQRNYGGTASSEAKGFIEKQMSEAQRDLSLAWLDEDSEPEQFTAFQQLTETDKHLLLAYCVATTLQPKLAEGAPQTAYDVALSQTGANVAEYWRPSATSYLSRIPKDQLLEVGREVLLGGDSWAARMKDAKKAALVAELDKAFAKSSNPDTIDKLRNWLPAGMAFGVTSGDAKPVKRKKTKAA